MNEPSIEAPLPSVSASSAPEQSDIARRAILKKLGRYAAVTPPAVILLLAAASKRVAAITSVTSSRQLKDRVGVADGGAFLAALPDVGDGVTMDMIDGVGICLAAIKALATRLDALDCGLRPAAL